MKYTFRDLLTLLISLSILNSCKNPDAIGLDIDPGNLINATLNDTSSINIYTTTDDTLVTAGLAQHPFGNLDDPILGNTTSNLAMSIALPSGGLSFGSIPTVLDSAVLVLKYGAEFYGDSVGSTYNVAVHQLNEVYAASGTYYNNKTWSYNPTEIGSLTITRFALHDTISILDVIKGQKDTVRRVLPQLRIPLDKAFISDQILHTNGLNYSSNGAFYKHFKGLYLTINKNKSTGKGGIGFFDLTTATISGIDLYYKTIDGTTITDTSVVHLSATNNSAAANITHTFSPAVKSQLNNPTQAFSTVYVQSLGGLRAKVNFPFIYKLKDLGKITINKAELIVNVEDGSDALLPAAPRLIFYRTDVAGQRQLVPDGNSLDTRYLSEGGFGGFYDKVNKRYTFTITSYIQDLLTGRLNQYDTFIAPTTSNGITSPSGLTAGRALLGGASGTYKMKLNIIYSQSN